MLSRPIPSSAVLLRFLEHPPKSRFLLLLLTAITYGCAGSATPAEPTTPPDVTEPGACEYRVEGKCYADRDQACLAAGCELSRCMILESYPMQIRCH